MGKKNKKQFIDKKHASTYTLMHRTQAELAVLQAEEQAKEGGTAGASSVSASTMVLWPHDHDGGTAVISQPQTATTATAAQRKPSSSSSKMNEIKRQLQQAHLVVEDDNNRYLKDLTGTGVFVSAQGQVGIAAGKPQTTAPANSTAIDIDDADLLLLNKDNNTVRLFENINLTTDVMDDDMAAALFEDELFGEDDDGDGGLEELDDDFCWQAAQEPEEEKDEKDQFDYDAHIQQLLEKARREREQQQGISSANHHHSGFHSDQAFFRQLQPLYERADSMDEEFEGKEGGEDEESLCPGVVPKLSPEEERALCEKFQATLAEYDDDSDDDNDVEHDDDNELERYDDDDEDDDKYEKGDRELQAALDDFLTEKQDDILVQGRAGASNYNKKQGGSGYAALVGTRMVPASCWHDDDHANKEEEAPPPPVESILAQAKEVLARPIHAPPPEEVVIYDYETKGGDGGFETSKSYIAERVRNPWDCESILSTYSNLDNNPVVIEHEDAQRRRRRRRQRARARAQQQQQQQELQQSQKIELSNKTGLPLLRENNREQEYQEEEASMTTTTCANNRGEARNKQETAAEKRARKAVTKQERQVSRLQRKVTRDVFGQEFQKRQAVVLSDTIGGSTVFRYS